MKRTITLLSACISFFFPVIFLIIWVSVFFKLGQLQSHEVFMDVDTHELVEFPSKLSTALDSISFGMYLFLPFIAPVPILFSFIPLILKASKRIILIASLGLVLNIIILLTRLSSGPGFSF